MSSVEDQVRRRLQDRLVSAGVRRGDVALEVLYWLPSEFLDEYSRLFLKALSLPGDSGATGRDDNVVAKVKGGIGPKGAKRGERGTAGSMRALGGGKRYYKGEWIVKDEIALEIKERVDRRLRGLVVGVARMVRDEQQRASAGNEEGEEGGVLTVMGDGEGGGETRGSIPGNGQGEGGEGLGEGEIVRMRGKAGTRVCQRCGRIAGKGWVRCPYPHA